MAREKMPPARIAAGWAIGMAVGCAVPFGLQLVVSVPLAVATRTSKIGAVAATFITNPVTIFFIYPAQTWAVYRLFFGENPALPAEWTPEAVFALSGRTVTCFFAGGIALAAMLAPLTYLAVLRIAKRAQAAAAERGRGGS